MKGCCQTLTGSPKSCDANLGGIERIWGGCYDDTGVTIDGNQVTAIPADGFVEYFVNRETSSATTTITIDDANGVFYYSTVLAMQLVKMDTAKLEEIHKLARTDAWFIIKDMNSDYWLYNYDRSMRMTGDSVIQTGQAMGDLNGATLNFLGVSEAPPTKLAQAAIDQLLA